MSTERTDRPVAARAGVVDLTVVVPAYNEEHRLGPTLDAVTAYLNDVDGGNRWGDWEIVVVDDGSTDRTREIAERAAAAAPEGPGRTPASGSSGAPATVARVTPCARASSPPAAAVSWSPTPTSRRPSRSWKPSTRRSARAMRPRSVPARGPARRSPATSTGCANSSAAPATS